MTGTENPISIVIISPESFPLFGDTVKYFPTHRPPPPPPSQKKKNKMKYFHIRNWSDAFSWFLSVVSITEPLVPESCCSDGLFKYSSKHGTFSLIYFKVFPISGVRLFVKPTNRDMGETLWFHLLVNYVTSPAYPDPHKLCLFFFSFHSLIELCFPTFVYTLFCSHHLFLCLIYFLSVPVKSPNQSLRA